MGGLWPALSPAGVARSAGIGMRVRFWRGGAVLVAGRGVGSRGRGWVSSRISWPVWRLMMRMCRLSTSSITGCRRGGAGADVVQSAVVAQGDGAVVVDPVGADPVVGGDDRTGREGSGSGGIGMGGGPPVQRPVGSDGVVVPDELVQLVL